MISKNKEKPEYFNIYGWHALAAALHNPDRVINKILVLKEKKEFFEKKFSLILKKRINTKIIYLEKSKFKLFEEGKLSSQGVIAKVKKIKPKKIELLLKENSAVLLDGVTDPQNVGAIIRSAVAFDIKNIIQTKHYACQENTLLNKASTGGIDKINMYQIINISNFLKNLKKENWWIVGLDSKAKYTLRDFFNENKKLKKILFIFGSEGSGLRMLTKRNCDFVVNIPINSSIISSINVSNACAITFYEINNFYKK